MNGRTWNYSAFWSETTKQLKKEISEQEYTMWLSNVEYHSANENQIILTAPSSFVSDQIRQRYLQLLESKLYELSGLPIKVTFQTQTPKAAEKPKKASPAEPKPAKKDKEPHPLLRKDYDFENFVIGENNSFAANAAYAIARNPGTAYNPCLVYGGVGLGKTHLIQAIGNAVHQEFDDKRIVYATAENFTYEFIESLRKKETHRFKNKYRGVDVLLIDDIHFLQNKKETQEELFHTFNALYDSNKQIVFTCDRPVSELKDISDRLKNRFERGLNVDLQPPNYETRYAILSKKIESAGLSIAEEVINLICNNVTTNVRDLEAALTKLIAYSDLVHKDITLDIAQQLLKDMFSSPKQSNITVDIIQRITAEYFGLSPNDLKGRKRTKAISLPRQVAMYVTREITELSTTEVGYEFGGRDHTTVMHACQKIEDRTKTDPTLEPTIQQLIRKIKDTVSKS